jgi:hypothetical protein
LATYPDVVALVVDYLTPLVDPTPVVSRVPNPRPATFVQVRRVGGSAITVRDQARLDVFTWGADDTTAHDLCMQVRTLLHALAGTTTLGPTCYGVDEFTGPRSLDDGVSGQPRWWMTLTITVRAE